MVEQQVLAISPTVGAQASSATSPWTGWGEAPYNGASQRREAMRAWNPSRGSADRDTILSLDMLRARSRDLVRNVPVASAAVLSLCTNVVGTGLKARPRLNAKLLGITDEAAEAWEERARHLFDLWANSKNCDAERKSTFPQLQDLALRTKKVAGDCFALPILKYTPASPFALCIKLLDGDRCRNPNTAVDSNELAGGIEVEPDGSPAAYHFTIAPDNGLLSTGLTPTVRVPARGAETGRPMVFHLLSVDRPDQRRGVPWLAPVMEVIKQQGRYQDAEIMAAVVSGMYTVFVKTPMGDSDTFGNVDTADRVEQIGVSADKAPLEMKAGGVVDLATGEDITLANPSRPNPNYDPFVNSIFREIGAALGVPVEVMLKFFSSSYTAARAAFLEGWKTFKRERVDLVVDFCQPVYEQFIMESVLLGYLDAPGFFQDPLRRMLWTQAVWIGDAPGQLDPLKETQAHKLQVDEQFKDRESAIIEINGGSYEHAARGLAREQKIRTDLGLPVPGGVLQTSTKSVQATTDDPSDEGTA